MEAKAVSPIKNSRLGFELVYQRETAEMLAVYSYSSIEDLWICSA